MRVLVVGASRGTGAELVGELAQRGHVVTAFSRHAEGDDERISYRTGDVTDVDAVTKAVAGQDAVMVTLGIPDNPFLVRLTRRASSRLDVRSAGTASVVGAMAETGFAASSCSPRTGSVRPTAGCRWRSRRSSPSPSGHR